MTSEPRTGNKERHAGAEAVKRSLLASRRSALGALLLAAALLANGGPARASSADLVASYHLDEGQGQIALDASPNGNTAVLGSSVNPDPNDPTWTAPGRFGAAALQFSGNQWAQVESSPSLETPGLTVEAWVRASGTPGRNRYLLAKGADGLHFASYAFYAREEGLAFYVSDDADFAVSPPVDAARIWDGQWHHVAGTFDGAWVRLFVDGVEVG